MHTRLIIILLMLSLGGCVHGSRKPSNVGLPAGAPDAQAILTDLQANSAALNSLRIKGYISMRLPGEKATQGFHGGIVQFQQPDRFYMRGRKAAFRVQAYAEGDRYLLVLPSEETFYVGREEEHVNGDSLDSAPSQMLKELFLLNGGIPDGAGRIDVEAYDEAAQTALLAVYTAGRPRRLERQIQVVHDREWRVTGVTVFDTNETEVVTATYASYKAKGGVSIPAKVTVKLTRHDAKMGYIATKETDQIQCRLRSQAPLPMKTINEARAEALAKGYTERLGIPQRENLR